MANLSPTAKHTKGLFERIYEALYSSYSIVIGVKCLMCLNGALAVIRLVAPFSFLQQKRDTMSKLKQGKQKQIQHFRLKEIKPLTENQNITFQEYDMGKNLMLHGIAGTGKTYISLYLALEEILKNNSCYDQVVVTRSVVPSRDMGFLPGNVKEKAKEYEAPYRTICDDLFGRGDGYDILRQRNLVNFVTTSHLRGTTFYNSIVIVDEFQNMTFPELDTVITRMGENCRLIFCGDVRQTDLQKDREKSGVLTFKNIIDRIDSFTSIEFGVDDIVRSELVKQYILAKLEHGIV